MMRNIYAPTDFKSFTVRPDISPEKKLQRIARHPVEVVEDKHGCGFLIGLPFGPLADVCSAFPDDTGESYMLIWNIYLGDSALYGHGIGTRLVKAAVRHELARTPDLARVYTGWTRLGLLNTFVKVFGEENVAALKGATKYGWQTDRPLDQMLVDIPPEPDKRYLVCETNSRVDTELAATWERPVEVRELTQEI